MRKHIIVLLSMALLAGCGGAPPSPHIYVVGVDCSSSFWNISHTSQQRFADLPRRAVQAIGYRVRNILNEISIITESRNFVRMTPVEDVSSHKTVDRDGIQKELVNAIDMATALTDSSREDRHYAIGAIRNNLEAMQVLMNKRNYIRLASRSEGRVMNEDVSPEALVRIQQLVNRVRAELDKFNYTVTVPVQPGVLNAMHRTISSMVEQIAEAVQLKNDQPRDRRWEERRVYGQIGALNPIIYFTIGDLRSTSYKPQAADLENSLSSMVAATTGGDQRVFAASSDYRSFFQRSVSEIANLVSTWGDFDRDVGVDLTFVIIGDGKHDPSGKYENSGGYKTEMLKDLQSVLSEQKGGESVIPGLPWESINSINIELCVPQKSYNTDILNAWAQTFHTVRDGKIQVHYHMIEKIQSDGLVSSEALEKLLQ